MQPAVALIVAIPLEILSLSIGLHVVNADRAIEPAALAAMPQDCAVVTDLGPRNAYAPAEVRLLKDYLGRGGRVLLAYDPQFPV